MKSNLPMLNGQEGEALAARDPRGLALEPWAEESRESGQISPRRLLAALVRHKWILVLAVVLGAGAAYTAYHSVAPEYTARGSVWISREDNGSSLGQPISQGELFSSSAWLDLLRSFAVLDPVVLQERLYLLAAPADSALFSDFTLSDRFVPGEYTLTVAENGDRWWLETPDGETQDDGVPGDSVGATLGFAWHPPASELFPEREVEFRVVSPRDASISLFERLRTGFTDKAQNFITLSMAGRDPEQITRILRSVMRQFATLAGSLKNRDLVERTAILAEQVDTVRNRLERTEAELQNFQVATITLPSDVSGPVAPGLQETQGPVIGEYFSRRLNQEALLHDRDRIRAVLNELGTDGAELDVVALELIPSVSQSSELSKAMGDLVGARAALRELEERYTAEHALVQDALERIRTLERQTIPSLARTLLGRLDERAAEEERLLEGRAADLRSIPVRTIREAQLRREVERLDALFRDLQNRYATGQLAAASSIPDVQILDLPEVPSLPSRDDRARWAGLAFLATIGIGIAGIVLLEMFDPHIRYPLQLQDDLGMEILGAIPRIRLQGKANTSEVTEAFREIRMHLEFSYGSTKPLIVAITSPDTGEGKTLVSANLAIAFSQLGRRTLLIDADTRRGDVHELLEMDRKPGLTEMLRGTAIDSVVRPTGYGSLYFAGSGSRISSSPELLSSSRMQDLMAEAKRNFEVILMDCPPMAAGGDAFVLGAHAGAVLFVMRSGSTHRELAKAKIEAFYRLPVRILGAVLNDVDAGSEYGHYRYYSYYLPGYRAGEEQEEEPSPEPATL